MRKINIKTGTVAKAPISTAKNIDSFPSSTKKSKKLISANPASIIDVVSPTKVAAPCKLDETAILIITGTGETFSFFEIAMPIGASIKTVATLSIKAETSPLNTERTTRAAIPFGILAISPSAILFGILDSENIPTEITETLKAFNVSDSDLVVFQPHTYSRTRLLAEEFVAALKTVKNLLIYKTFPAREKFNIDGDAFTLYKMIKGVNCGVKFAADYKDLSKKVNLYSAKKEKSRRIIVLGAGDVYYDAKKIIIENACQSR